jgi:single-strand DNA-binding protein
MRTNINKVELAGYAGRDAEVREIKSGINVASFSLATSENYRDKNGEWISSTSWHNIVMWNDIAKKAAEEIKKGTHVSLTGKISYRNYETKTGEKRYVAEIVVNDFKVNPKEE